MGSSLKFVFVAAVAGIFIGLAGLFVAVTSKNQSDELRNDFSVVEDLRQKLGEIENSSSGLSAGTARIQREVEALRTGTQDALDRVSAELTRMRTDLNETVAFAEGMREGFLGLQERLLDLEGREVFVAVAESEPEAGDVVEENVEESVAEVETVEEESAVDEFYVIRSGDTLSSVAADHGISLARLLEANAEVDPRRLQVGQKISLPTR